jgi:hypothetical protein
VDLRVSALLSMQRALWDIVTPGLRGVAVRVGEGEIVARFLFEHEPGDDDREDVSLAESTAAADFLEDFRVSFDANWLPTPAPRALVDGEEWVYLRKEA